MLVLFGMIVVVVGIVVARRHASAVYDAVIIRLTKQWYGAVLATFDDDATILDIGIGTATALVAHADVVKRKRLIIKGVDYEPAYIRTAARRLREAGLDAEVRCEVRCASVYDAETLRALRPPKGFDGAYFSGSLTLMPDPVAALHAAAAVLGPRGRIHVTQTYQRRALPFLATLKPLLTYMTTIDFGQLTTETMAMNIFKTSGFTIIQHQTIPGSVDTPLQAAYHTILAPNKTSVLEVKKATNNT